MAIINRCPLTGVVSATNDTVLTLSTNYLHSIMGCSIAELIKMSDDANMPRHDRPTDTKLLFCAFAKQAKLLVHNRHLLEIDTKVTITHFNLLKSLAIYLNKEPNFYKRIPKYAHYTGTFVGNFGHYLELIKKEKELYIEERKNLKQKYKEQETILAELNEKDIAETKLGLMASKYAAKLKLTEETSNNFSVSKQLAQYITVAMQVSNDVQEYFAYIISSPVSKLKNDIEVKEIDLIDVIESLEDWETGLAIKYAMLSFLRKKLAAYNSYSGRKVSKIDISDLDFLLGDIELVESKTVESTARSEAARTNSTIENSTIENSEASATVENSTEEDTSIPVPINQTKPASSMSLAASILAKIQAKKKGN